MSIEAGRDALDQQLGGHVLRQLGRIKICLTRVNVRPSASGLSVPGAIDGSRLSMSMLT